MLMIEGFMNKSNKLTVFYVISSVSLFLVLLFGGAYGVYVSVGLNFVKSNSIPNELVGNNGVENVSFGGSVNYSPSMVGVIFLSIILIVIAIFDFISLIKQVIFFKQFKAVSDSNLTKKIESKTPSKGSVIFWTFVIDILSFVAGVVGLFINNRCFVGGNEMSWLFYLIDGLVSILSLVSIVLLIIKLKNKATEKRICEKNHRKIISSNNQNNKQKKNVGSKEIAQMEYNLMKLESMKKGKIVTEEEYKKLRKQILNFEKVKSSSFDIK